MRRKGTAEIGMLFHKHGLPKSIHLVQMLRPPPSYSPDKDGTDELVLPDPAIKGINQQADVLDAANIHTTKVRIVRIIKDKKVFYFIRILPLKLQAEGLTGE